MESNIICNKLYFFFFFFILDFIFYSYLRIKFPDAHLFNWNFLYVLSQLVFLFHLSNLAMKIEKGEKNMTAIDQHRAK